MGSVILDLELDECLNFSCANVDDMNEVYHTIESIRRTIHGKIDDQIDDAVAVYLRNKYKYID